MFAKKIGGFVLLLGACIGGAFAHPGAHAMMGHSDEMVAHVNGMLQFLYDGIGATDTQKAKLAAISESAANDLKAMHQSMAQTHEQAFAVLTQDTIDRSKLETIRVEQMRVADEVSRRITQFAADVAQELTPAQRKALAEHFAHHADS
jgi:Spy/CpxP family protein refolding chaperone